MASKVSAVMPTVNPQRYVIQWALDSLANQTLSRSDFEVFIVDNNSNPPLDPASLNGTRGLPLRIISEPQPGCLFARCTGIKAAQGDLIVFLDDDNYLDPDYLAEAVRIAEGCPTIGAFGGITRFLCEGSIPTWKRQLFPYLAVRDYGPEVITSTEDRWGPWEPVGAGMACRRDIGLEFVRVVDTDPMAQLLGRRSRTFICGDDSLLARMAYRLGYSCSYQPSLKLTHMIKSTRLTPQNLAKTLDGIARAYVIYETVLGRPQPAGSFYATVRELFIRCRWRIQQKGTKAGLIEWFWDVGYFSQVRQLQKHLNGRRNGSAVLNSHSEL